MSGMIHHHAATPLCGGEGDAFDVLETDDGISINQGGNELAYGFESVEAAIAKADEMADAWLRESMTLDRATDLFDNEPSDFVCGVLLNQAANYHRDEMLSDVAFQMIVKRVAEWLADDIKLGD